MKRGNLSLSYLLILISFSYLSFNSSHGQETLNTQARQNPSGNKKSYPNINDTRPVRGQNGTLPNGCSRDLSMAIDKCARPLMDLIEGKIEVWPKDEKDTLDLCNRISGAEKCIKDVSRRCAKGIQKTIYTTFANSVQRARKQECSKERINNILNLTKCIEKNQGPIQVFIGNVTNQIAAINQQFPDPSKKVTGLCCMVKTIELEVRQILDPKCPTGSATVVRLYRAILEDVMDLICRQAKCEGIFKGLKRVQRNYQGGLIAAVMRILESLS